MDSSTFSDLWTERYRPRSLEDILLPKETHAKLQDFKNEKTIPNLLFVGPPGLGKTTLAKIIVNSLLECDHLYINASDENGIDTIRIKIINFAQTKSFTGGVKVVILDESDRLTNDAQSALRNVMEEYASITRFVLTANYKHKIIPALQSRTQTLDFNNNVGEVAKHCIKILKQENIEVAEDQKGRLIELIKSVYPDIRKIINTLQQCCIKGKLNIHLSKTNSAFLEKLYELLTKNNIVDVREFIIQNEDQYHNDHHLLMKAFLNFIYDKDLEEGKKRNTIINIAEYMYRHSFVIDPEINSYVCFINIQKILK